ncbi:hypothetical protein NPIL_439211 [Nephila pilipes]|uniref:Uncharacterized protein n=1 Tax=Nephila pilipes TaxID=299642 RepID=A0A8X6N5C8_NEPPI|nr:hypothetical protein NPIL_439211 [Nephila pilipes]
MECYRLCLKQSRTSYLEGDVFTSAIDANWTRKFSFDLTVPCVMRVVKCLSSQLGSRERKLRSQEDSKILTALTKIILYSQERQKKKKWKRI